MVRVTDERLTNDGTVQIYAALILVVRVWNGRSCCTAKA